MDGAQYQPEGRPDEDADQDRGVLRASGEMPGCVTLTVGSRLRVMAVCSGSGRERLVRGSEEPVADENHHHEEGRRESARCRHDGDDYAFAQAFTV